MTKSCAAAFTVLLLVLNSPLATAAEATPSGTVAETEMFAAIDKIFADYALDSHIPGLV